MMSKAIEIICAGGLLIMCLSGCGKDTVGSAALTKQEIAQNIVADSIHANNNVEDDDASGNMGVGEFYDGANLQGSVVELSETGFYMSPAYTEKEEGGGEILAEAAPGTESDENNIQITYMDNTVFQIVNLSMSTQSEVSREYTDKESVKKQSSVCVFGSCQDTYHWTADKILILKWQ